MKNNLLLFLIFISNSVFCQDCINCYYLNSSPVLQSNSYNSYFYGGMPWFYPYGKIQYYNWNAPGMMINDTTYMQGNNYPGSGGVGLVKPNIYIDGKPGLQFDIKINIPTNNLWIASPKISSNGWAGSIESNNQIRIGNQVWPFIYVDYRADEKHFQHEMGFCGNKSNVAKEMLAILQHLRFSKNEINDFLDHWPSKLPKADEYCVFPQDNQQINKMAPITTNPSFNLIRIYFYVILWDKNSKPKNFAQKPLLHWTTKLFTKFDESKPTIREWGVGFPMK